ncbi:LLM class F420-dependent oxidoreductase [Actinoallomurus iriomotensis]|uniref:LLM class F420-dependent oxidoreductase n=1 Tax=Actinoallomurus iriomotensis TaxID=478107 RepID=A0A9W6S0E7_9ACTN|nr:LLM class F420-dependent oxidoreductase [Actinoallomurus iriomotensis]GLY85006.1 LLM class F420-dependent oxidoreductase [Actinoallomurus iriomotensis]
MDISAVVGMWLDRPPEEALHTAVLADRLGFGELWIGETGTWDAFALATAVGLATDAIALTVGPMPVAVRDPAMIAMGAASVTALTRRRVGVALGTSNPTLVEDWHGRSRAGAAGTLEESVRAVATLLGGGRTNGESGFRLRLGPPEGPLTVAALGDRAIATAAAYADRMVINLVTPQQAADLKEKLDTAARKAGRPTPRLAAWMPAAVDPVPESYAQLIWGLVPYLSVPGYSANLAAAGFSDAVELARAGTAPRDLLTALPLELAGTIGLAGDTAAVRSRLAAYADAGVDEVAVVPVTGGDPGGERTLSALRKL